ncbi:MAG: hypothetical protein M1436_04070, partial [Acidobacteria bacterium]|nr:hypothetical protein [Acidobacteriota bacterium]
MVLRCAVLLGASMAASGQDWYLTGKVVMEDGTPPPGPVTIEKFCGGTSVSREGRTDAQGRFVLRNMGKDMLVGGAGGVSLNALDETHFALGGMTGACLLRASLPGYHSNTFDLSERRPVDDPNLPPFVLTRGGPDAMFKATSADSLPNAARRAWERAGKASGKKDWAETERQLRAAVQASPKFTDGWRMLGMACQNQHKLDGAREAYRHAIANDPKFPGTYALLAPLEIEAKEWDKALQTSQTLIRLDTKRRYPEAFLNKAAAEYH